MYSMITIYQRDCVVKDWALAELSLYTKIAEFALLAASLSLLTTPNPNTSKSRKNYNFVKDATFSHPGCCGQLVTANFWASFFVHSAFLGKLRRNRVRFTASFPPSNDKSWWAMASLRSHQKKKEMILTLSICYILFRWRKGYKVKPKIKASMCNDMAKVGIQSWLVKGK